MICRDCESVDGLSRQDNQSDVQQSDNILNNFGRHLRNKREVAALSQEQLAALLEVDRTYISLLECGKRNPSLSLIHRICIALECSFSDLLPDIS